MMSSWGGNIICATNLSPLTLVSANISLSSLPEDITTALDLTVDDLQRRRTVFLVGMCPFITPCWYPMFSSALLNWVWTIRVDSSSLAPPCWGHSGPIPGCPSVQVTCSSCYPNAIPRWDPPLEWRKNSAWRPHTSGLRLPPVSITILPLKNLCLARCPLDISMSILDVGALKGSLKGCLWEGILYEL